ncbi:MAG: sigma-70 family RNA polymerase sigma factor [Chloroflexota bacterium]|nr:sigma-70 family RNA polymerase sigma factor [Chloroflexota bacterium]
MTAPNDHPETSVSPDEDAPLIARARAGEAAAFGALYDRYVEAVYRYVFYRVRETAEAEDVTSEVFMKALRAMPRYETRQPFLAWLYRIARNAVIDRARRRRTQVSFEDALAHPNADRILDPDATLFQQVDAETLRGAIRQLTSLQQEVIVLRYVEGLDTRAIARIVGKREGTVRGIEFRALGALRQLVPSREALG